MERNLWGVWRVGLPKYLFFFVSYLLFFELLVFLTEIEISHHKILLFSLLLVAIEPIRDYWIWRQVQQEQHLLLHDPWRVEEELFY